MNNLKCEKIYFENISFKRTGIVENDEIESNVLSEWYSSNEDSRLVKLVLKLFCKNEGNFEINIDMAGVFLLDAETEEQKQVYMRSAVAILMPYLRCQLSLITSQPDMKPIVMPIVNLKAQESSEDK